MPQKEKKRMLSGSSLDKVARALLDIALITAPELFKVLKNASRKDQEIPVIAYFQAWTQTLIPPICIEALHNCMNCFPRLLMRLIEREIASILLVIIVRCGSLYRTRLISESLSDQATPY